MKSIKSRILQSARAVFIQQGSGGFSMRKVAAEANLALARIIHEDDGILLDP